MRAGIRVSHVDDEPDLADLTAEFLVREDDEFTVVTERTVADALARLETETVDCIVNDYEMPETDGIEFLETIRDSHPDLPFILYTGRGSEEVASDAISAGVTDYLQNERCRAAIARMESLIDDLLDLARGGSIVADRELVDLADLATECWATIATPEATLVVDTTRTLEADRPRLKQVIENLLTNAVVHGGEDVTVTISDLDDGFSVADNGPGIPSDERATVFDYGYSTHPDGNGFGLSIVHEIATAHGWDVDVTEDSNGGARIEFTGISRTR